MQKTKSLNTCLLAAVGLLLTGTVYAGPPFITDDPEPVEAQTWEVNYAYAKTWREGSSSTAMPSVDMNYGLTSDIQLHAQPRYSREEANQLTLSGVDNTGIGVKYRFYDVVQPNQRIMLGIYPIAQLPTGDKKLGDTRGKTQLFLPLWAQLNTGPWTIYGGTGYRLNNSVDGTNSWFLGSTVLYTVSEKLRLGGEVFRESKVTLDETHTSGFNLGGIYNMTDDYHVLFSAGRGLNHVKASNDLSAYLALQVIY